jgi:hypothetical protein
MVKPIECGHESDCTRRAPSAAKAKGDGRAARHWRQGIRVNKVGGARQEDAGVGASSASVDWWPTGREDARHLGKWLANGKCGASGARVEISWGVGRRGGREGGSGWARGERERERRR